MNVFVKYLPTHMNDASLRELFSSCGRVVSAKVMVDQSTGLSLGFGFVRFETPEEAQAAMKKMTGWRTGGKTLRCRLSDASIYPDPTDNLYVKPLPADFTEEQLVELFAPYGNIITATILVDRRTGVSKQVGFVRYDKVESATVALEKLDGSRLAPHKPWLIVKYAESDSQKAVRQARNVSPTSTPSPPPYYIEEHPPSDPPSPNISTSPDPLFIPAYNPVPSPYHTPQYLFPTPYTGHPPFPSPTSYPSPISYPTSPHHAHSTTPYASHYPTVHFRPPSPTTYVYPVAQAPPIGLYTCTGQFCVPYYPPTVSVCTPPAYIPM